MQAGVERDLGVGVAGEVAGFEGTSRTGNYSVRRWKTIVNILISNSDHTDDFHIMFRDGDLTVFTDVPRDGVFPNSTRCTSMKCGFRTTDGAPEQFVL